MVSRVEKSPPKGSQNQQIIVTTSTVEPTPSLRGGLGLSTAPLSAFISSVDLDADIGTTRPLTRSPIDDIDDCVSSSSCPTEQTGKPPAGPPHGPQTGSQQTKTPSDSVVTAVSTTTPSDPGEERDEVSVAATKRSIGGTGSYRPMKTSEFEFQVPPEAPVFQPTVEEFQNPLTYISKIRPYAEKYGICKIKPPASWQPPFTVDVDNLRFTPRVQRLNELEAKTRVKLNFLDQIAKFWELQGSSLKIPMVERKALDLYSLHRVVQEEGGLEQTTRDRKWSRVAQRLNYPIGKNVGTILKGHYERILYPFDIYTSGKVEELTKKSPPKLEPDIDDHDYKPHGIVSRQNVTPPNETTARRSKRFQQQQESTIGMDTDCKSSPPKFEFKKPFGAELDVKSQEICDLTQIQTSPTEKSISPAEMRRLQISGAGPKMAGFRQSPGKSRMSTGGGGGTTPPTTPPKRQFIPRRHINDPLAKYICQTCMRGDGEESMLLCDGCDDSYHTFCLIPSMTDIPKGEWRCPKCVVEEVNKPTEAFGFEQAQREYTLQQFGRMADQFKADYFNMPVHLVPTALVEREFWRIVSSIDEDVAVEYGADLHTMDHGSGFPTKSSLFLQSADDQEYAESSWNLNNLPLLEESILGYINADISGMKVPWMYVGMCFATFCWHNEDHWSYSINYLHWGESKTWYGVPGKKAESFENTMKRAAPELFQSQPDLLHQLVTIMNPNILMNAGVPVYRTDQHAGEFVITFPRAYHAGFNQGYNFAEAVNFAPADWLKMGRECVNHYSTLRRFCVFSHDELVCKMALEPDRLNFGIATACYLDMAEMVDTEKKLRKSLLEWGVTKAEREAFEIFPDDERQCDVCKTTCFLSAVTCSCIPSLVCLRHYSELCKCPPDQHTLKYRYTLDELPFMLRKLKIKAESFETWLRAVRDVIDPTKKAEITLEELQELANEAETKKFPLSALLQRLNSAVLEAEKCVTVIQQLDINKMRTRTRNSGEFPKYKLTLEELDLFVEEVDNLCCVIKEGNSVRELQQLGKQFVRQADDLLKEPIYSVDPKSLARLIDDGQSLCIELPQLVPLKVLHEQSVWFQAVRTVRSGGEKLPVATVQKLFETGMNLVPNPVCEKQLFELDGIVKDVEQWERMAKQCFESGTEQQIPEIEQLLQKADSIDGQLTSYTMLKDALKRAKEWLATVAVIHSNENYPYYHTMVNLVARGKAIPFQLTELKRMRDHIAGARQWKQRTSRTFLKKSAHFALMQVLSPRTDPVMYARPGSRPLDDDLQQFTDAMEPVHMVISFKAAEEKEMREMRELRRDNLSKNPERDQYCICRQSFSATMLHCQLCKDWFHVACVPTPRSAHATSRTPKGSSPNLNPLLPTTSQLETIAGSKSTDAKYLCPSCQRSKRPRLETILTLLVALQRLPIRLPEGEALQCLTERAMNWQDRARQALSTDDVVAALAVLSHMSSDGGVVAGGKRIPLPGTGKQMSGDTTDDSDTGDGLIGTATNRTVGEDSTGSTDSRTSPKRNIDHAYSVPLADASTPFTPITGSNGRGERKISTSSTQPTVKPVDGVTISPLSTNDSPLIRLNTETKEYLEELMMEGDLLEVSLDETQHLWRILNAAKPSGSDLALIKSTYKIKSDNSSTLVTDTVGQQKATVTTATKRTALPKSIGTDPAMSPDSVDAQPATKPKRSRKLKLTAKDEVQRSGADGPVQKKKKRGRKSNAAIHAIDKQVGSSDDDEECSAVNCQRPTGREVDWVQCDGCNKWFHMLCVGLNKNQLKPDEDYVCKLCGKEDPNVDKPISGTVPIATSGPDSADDEMDSIDLNASQIGTSNRGDTKSGRKSITKTKIGGGGGKKIN